MFSHPTVGFEVKSLSHLFKRRMNAAIATFPEDGVLPTSTQGYIIGYLYAHQDEDIFQRDIEQECSIRRSTATGILQLMEKNGWITRIPVEYDARLKKIVLTDRSRQHHERIHATILQLEALATRGIPPEDLDCFYRTVERIKHNLE